MLPIGFLVAMLFLGMLWIITAENRRKARSDRIFEKMCSEPDLRSERVIARDRASE